MTPTTAELVIWLRNMAIGLRASGEPTHDNDKGFDFAADRLSALPPRDELLREALDSLTWALTHIEPIEEEMYSDLGAMAQESHDGSAPISPFQRLFMDSLRRARAAADKIRAALEHQQKETP